MIDISTSIIEDLYPDSLLTQKGALESNEKKEDLKAYRISARKSDSNESLKALAEACGKQIIPFFKKNKLSNFSFWLFLSHGPWQPKTKIVRYKKLWKSPPFDSFFGNGIPNSDQIEIDSTKGIRYAAIVNVEGEALLKAVELVRTNFASFIVASRRPEIISTPSVKEIFSIAFPKDMNGVESVHIHWINLSTILCSKGDLVIRVSGLYDDIESTVDIIFTDKFV